jgi:hypothetical protein
MISAANEIATTSKRDGRMFFGVSLHFWENTMVVSLIIAGGFAFLAGLATWAVVTLQRVEIAESNARQSEAELKLAELRDKVGRPRSIDAEVLKAALESVPRRPIVLSWVEKDPDSTLLSLQMGGALEKAGWEVTQLGRMPEFIKLCSGDFGGIYVMTKALLPEEIKFFEEMGHVSPAKTPNTAFLQLAAALRTAMATMYLIRHALLFPMISCTWPSGRAG